MILQPLSASRNGNSRGKRHGIIEFATPTSQTAFTTRKATRQIALDVLLVALY